MQQNATFVRRLIGLLALALTAAACGLLLTSVNVAAKGKPGGGGGGGTVPAGTIYVDFDDGLFVMKADGGDKTPLPLNVFGQPSQVLHGGQRWFLDVRQIPGETYPHGGPRVELFAVRDDGDEQFTVQLTDDPSLEVNPRINFSDRVNKVGWAPLRVAADTVIPDARVSFEAVAWDLGEGLPLGAGIYTAAIDFDADGNVLGLANLPVPEQPLLELPLDGTDNNGDGFIDIWTVNSFGFDWAPDGTALTWGEDQLDGPGILHVVDLLEGDPVSVPIAELRLNGNPRWSPDGTRIALALSEGIATITPDGADLDLIVRDASAKFTISSLGVPVWSPDSSHLVYSHFEFDFNKGSGFRDLIRVTADGRDKTNLTPDIDGDPYAVQWR